ncbi:DUF6538 domain-containing protein [Methylorubrum extorquens]|uniref:DUF6538 domain-containing protein n=1 Tax=Methylorubrum extorquens TaxID=408 RepID=UPI0020A13980|nr:DUF6538 domain-containing protein [Methylorubrum extorquens]MCP1538800.1 hypothetical protein [Methylorubrum extorquens]
MSRPQLRKGARTYRLRKRVPADLVEAVGRQEIAFSLRTKDPTEAKRLLAEELAKLEAHWTELRRGQSSTQSAAYVLVEEASAFHHSLSEREAAERAQWMYAHWLGLHRDNPSQQRFWPTDLYRHLWRPSSARLENGKDGLISVKADLDAVRAEKVD